MLLSERRRHLDLCVLGSSYMRTNTGVLMIDSKTFPVGSAAQLRGGIPRILRHGIIAGVLAFAVVWLCGGMSVHSVADEDSSIRQQTALGKYPTGTIDDLLVVVRDRCDAAGISLGLRSAMEAFLDRRFRSGFDGYWYLHMAMGTPVLPNPDHAESALSPFFRNLTGADLPLGLGDEALAATFVGAIEAHQSGQNCVTSFLIDPDAVFVAQGIIVGDPSIDAVRFETAGISAEYWSGEGTLCGRRWFGHCSTEDAISCVGGSAVAAGHLGIVALFADGSRVPIQLRFLHAPACAEMGSVWFVDRASRHGPTGSFASFASFDF